MRGVLVIPALLLLTGCGLHDAPVGPTAHDHEVVEPDGSALTHVQLTMGAGELEVRGGSSHLLEADFTYNLAAWKPSVTRTAAGDTTTVAVVQGSQKSVRGRTENRWEIALDDRTALAVDATLGAGEAHLTLGSLNLRGVTLGIGAGEVELDLRGTPTTSYRVKLRGGVGSAKVYLPASVGISARASGGIGSIDVQGLERRDGRWVNTRYGSSPVEVELDVQGGVGEITIVAE